MQTQHLDFSTGQNEAHRRYGRFEYVHTLVEACLDGAATDCRVPAVRSARQAGIPLRRKPKRHPIDALCRAWEGAKAHGCLRAARMGCKARGLELALRHRDVRQR